MQGETARCGDGDLDSIIDGVFQNDLCVGQMTGRLASIIVSRRRALAHGYAFDDAGQLEVGCDQRMLIEITRPRPQVLLGCSVQVRRVLKPLRAGDDGDGLAGEVQEVRGPPEPVRKRASRVLSPKNLLDIHSHSTALTGR